MANNSEFEFMEYVDETSIDPNLMCAICHKPFIDPVSTPCDHTYCRACITRWLTENVNYSCPTCSQQPILLKDLTQTSRLLRNILDQLRVRCTLCEQTGLPRGQYPDHINKICLKAVVQCQAADIKCPWKGARESLDGHASECVFEPLRPVLAVLIAENRQLREQVEEHNNKIKNLTKQMSQLNNNASVSSSSDSDDENVASSLAGPLIGNIGQKEEDAVFIRNLPATIKVNDIFDVFSKVGPIKYNKIAQKPEVFIFKSPNNRNASCNAKVVYADKEIAAAAVLKFNDKHIPEWNKRILVNISDPKKKNLKDSEKEENTGTNDDTKATGGRAQASNANEKSSNEPYQSQRSNEQNPASDKNNPTNRRRHHRRQDYKTTT